MMNGCTDSLEPDKAQRVIGTANRPHEGAEADFDLTSEDRPACYAVFNTSTVAIGSSPCSGRATSRPRPLFVTFNGACALSASK
jgi:hypothetical protein